MSSYKHFILTSLTAVLTLFAVPVFASLGPVDAVSGVLVSTGEDRAATQGVFQPGPGFFGNVGNDWRWTVTISVSEPRIIASIQVNHNFSGEAWATHSRRWNGLDLYPIVVFQTGVQQNFRYDARIGPLATGDNVFDLYGQIESQNFNGAVITVAFTDGTSVVGNIPANAMAVTPISMAGLSCNENDGGVNYDVAGTNNHSSGSGVVYQFQDNCIDDVALSEGICGGLGANAGKQMVTSIRVCPVACKNGACVGGGGGPTTIPGSVVETPTFIRNEVVSDRFESIP